jgi:hypothetical protein
MLRGVVAVKAQTFSQRTAPWETQWGQLNGLVAAHHAPVWRAPQAGPAFYKGLGPFLVAQFHLLRGVSRAASPWGPRMDSG